MNDDDNRIITRIKWCDKVQQRQQEEARPSRRRCRCFHRLCCKKGLGCPRWCPPVPALALTNIIQDCPRRQLAAAGLLATLLPLATSTAGVTATPPPPLISVSEAGAAGVAADGAVFGNFARTLSTMFARSSFHPSSSASFSHLQAHTWARGRFAAGQASSYGQGWRDLSA